MSKLFHISSATLPLLAAVLVLSLSAGYFTLAWSEPSGTMPASVDAPINTSNIAQTKAGSLTLGGSLHVPAGADGLVVDSAGGISIYTNELNVKSGSLFLGYRNTSNTIIQANSGNVGIGTTAPLAKLAVGGTGSSGDAIAAYANSANSALYAEQQNSTGGGYAGYFKGDSNITRNLFVGGNINATGTINSATALCVNSVCANSTTWNNIVIGAGSGSGGTWGSSSNDFIFLERSLIGTGMDRNDPWYISGWDPVSKKLARGSIVFSKNEFGNLVYEGGSGTGGYCGSVIIGNKKYSSTTRSKYAGNSGSCYSGAGGFGGAGNFQSLSGNGATIDMNENGPLATDGTYIYLFSLFDKDGGKKIYKYDQNLNALGTITLTVSPTSKTGYNLKLIFSQDGNSFYFYENKQIKEYDLSGQRIGTYNYDLKDDNAFFVMDGVIWTVRPLSVEYDDSNGGSNDVNTTVIGLEFAPRSRK